MAMMGCELPPSSFARLLQNLLNGLNSNYSGGKFSIVLMPPTRRAWPKEIRLTKRGLEILRIADFFQDTSYSFLSANVKQCQESRDCAFYCTPKFITTASCFGGICQYALVVEHVSYVPQVLSQFVVRKLIGFCGNY